MSTAWNIRPRAAKCSTCGQPFLPGARGHSLLEPLLSPEGKAAASPEGTGYLRRDLCEGCFAALPPAALRTLPAVWAFLVPKESQPKRAESPVRKETAEHLLRTLLEAHRPEDRAAIYVLAILLERSRKLIERAVRVEPDGRKVRLYEHRASGDLFPVEDPALQPADLPAVQARVLELLGVPAAPSEARP